MRERKLLTQCSKVLHNNPRVANDSFDPSWLVGQCHVVYQLWHLNDSCGTLCQELIVRYALALLRRSGPRRKI